MKYMGSKARIAKVEKEAVKEIEKTLDEKDEVKLDENLVVNIVPPKRK